MSDVPVPTNPGGVSERPANVRPEDLQSVPSLETASMGAKPPAAEGAPAPAETAPAPGGGGTPAGPPPKLSAADVAAALAAVPGGPPAAAPGGAVPTPTTAADVDVIEPEWVDKAEDVVKTHQGNPYGEEEGIEELQEDYLQKRYGIEVKHPDNAQGGKAGKPEGA